MNKFAAFALTALCSATLPGFVPTASATMCAGNAPVTRIFSSAPSARVAKPALSAIARVESSQIPTSDRLKKPVVGPNPISEPGVEAMPGITLPQVAKNGDCKKYFPSVGQLISVPCGQ
jgi:hypothetical protein